MYEPIRVVLCVSCRHPMEGYTGSQCDEQCESVTLRGGEKWWEVKKLPNALNLLMEADPIARVVIPSLKQTLLAIHEVVRQVNKPDVAVVKLSAAIAAVSTTLSR